MGGRSDENFAVAEECQFVDFIPNLKNIFCQYIKWDKICSAKVIFTVEYAFSELLSISAVIILMFCGLNTP